MKPLSIHEHYTEDHQQLDALFHRFQNLKATDRTSAEKAFEEFKAGRERHLRWEEEILFPSFERKLGHLQGGPTAVMRWEHQKIRQYLDAIAQRLARQDFDTEDDEIGLETVLCPHNRKEEEILYPMMDEMVGERERAEIFTAMDKCRRAA